MSYFSSILMQSSLSLLYHISLFLLNLLGQYASCFKILSKIPDEASKFLTFIFLHLYI